MKLLTTGLLGLLVLTGAAQADVFVSVDANGSYCLLYTSPSPRDQRGSRMPSSA